MIALPFETQRLILRGWEERDREAFHRLNADDDVMRFFPFRRSQQEADAVMDKLNAMVERDGITFFALEDKTSGALLGMTGLAHLAETMPMAPAVEIGWRLLPEAWGKGFASEAARACLKRGFKEMGLATVVSFCVVENTPSEAVMQRLGMRFVGTFDHPSVDPATHPHLVRHKAYEIMREEWRAKTSSGEPLKIG